MFNMELLEPLGSDLRRPVPARHDVFREHPTGLDGRTGDRLFLRLLWD